MSQNNKVVTERPDVELAVKAHDRNGGNRYTMILEAAVRARAMIKRRDGIDRHTARLNKYPMRPLSQAIQDIIDDYKTS
jgi:hypothetical protein